MWIKILNYSLNGILSYYDVSAHQHIYYRVCASVCVCVHMHAWRGRFKGAEGPRRRQGEPGKWADPGKCTPPIQRKNRRWRKKYINTSKFLTCPELLGLPKKLKFKKYCLRHIFCPPPYPSSWIHHCLPCLCVCISVLLWIDIYKILNTNMLLNLFVHLDLITNNIKA